jgi:hypothetical protein
MMNNEMTRSNEKDAEQGRPAAADMINARADLSDAERQALVDFFEHPAGGEIWGWEARAATRLAAGEIAIGLRTKEEVVEGLPGSAAMELEKRMPLVEEYAAEYLNAAEAFEL